MLLALVVVASLAISAGIMAQLSYKKAQATERILPFYQLRIKRLRDDMEKRTTELAAADAQLAALITLIAEEDMAKLLDRLPTDKLKVI